MKGHRPELAWKAVSRLPGWVYSGSLGVTFERQSYALGLRCVAATASESLNARGFALSAWKSCGAWKIGWRIQAGLVGR